MFLWRVSLTGGIPRVVRALLSDLDRDKFEVLVCTARPPADEDHLADFHGIRFCSLGLVGSVSNLRKVAAIRGLWSLTREFEPDVVHTHSGVAWYLAPWLAATRHGVPTVLEVHDSPQSGRVSRLNSSVEGFMMRRLGAVPLVHSSSVRNELSTATRIESTRIRTIAIGIDVAGFHERLRRAEWRRSVGFGDEHVVVTYVARLVASKNPSLFIQVATQVITDRPQCRFVLVGDGPEITSLEQMVAQAGLTDRVLLLRHVEDVAEVLAGSDIFLSTSDYEGFGIAVLEAMAAGLPVVTTAAGGVDDLVVPRETGFISPLRDLESIAKSVLKLVDSPAQRGEMAHRSAERAKDSFDAFTMVREYERLYLSLAKERQR
jgi:glycosyltransferase involved in cell wall biosynthesis